jgi:alkyldihydroxyacetonephosphate synthase
MKWWGWGDEQTEFEIGDKPELWPFIQDRVGLDGAIPRTPPVHFEDISLPPPRTNRAFSATLHQRLGSARLRTDKRERLVHAYGKSFRDLLRIRRGLVEAAPDGVVYPESEAEVEVLVKAAADHDVVLIPFGAGSNIAGCVEAGHGESRMVVTVDLRLMNRVLEVDNESGTARVEAGVLGPHLEDQLRPRGVTLGHFPDSFLFSTLGGWIATRSAGMQSDRYGKIEDMVLALRMVTPSGTIETRPVPRASNGIDVNHLCIGSEGTLGIITEATMQVHSIPEHREAYGYLFPDFEQGIHALRACVEAECLPVVSRLNDPEKTALSFAYKTASPPFRRLLAKGVKGYLKQIRRFDFARCALMLNVFEGDRYSFPATRKRVNGIFRRHGAFALGTEPGRAFERGKYDFPYLRDFVMDRNIMADVSETATVWSNIIPLYRSTRDAIEAAIRRTGVRPFVGCHISHAYRTGASLYFTFGCLQRPGQELEQYLYIKKTAEDCFIRGGATLSHHHAVGTEHLPWIAEDVSVTGLAAVRALKEGLDPLTIMNPGKILPSERPLEAWGLCEAAISAFDRNGN